MSDWHTRREKEIIREMGGTPTESYGADGRIDGDPVEVRLAREEERFRVNKSTHSQLKNNDGSYILDDVEDSQPPESIPADQIDDRLSDDWHSDRGYMHQFLDVSEIL
jgi:hypothetical protein